MIGGSLELPVWFTDGLYRPQRSWAKVIFSQACVCPQGGRVSASVHAGITPHPPTHPQSRPHPEQTPPPRSRHPPEQTPPNPQSRHPQEQTPPGIRLQHTVYEGPVHILLECILVRHFVWKVEGGYAHTHVQKYCSHAELIYGHGDPLTYIEIPRRATKVKFFTAGSDAMLSILCNIKQAIRLDPNPSSARPM